MPPPNISTTDLDTLEAAIRTRINGIVPTYTRFAQNWTHVADGMQPAPGLVLRQYDVKWLPIGELEGALTGPARTNTSVQMSVEVYYRIIDERFVATMLEFDRIDLWDQAFGASQNWDPTIAGLVMAQWDGLTQVDAGEQTWAFDYTLQYMRTR